MFNLFRYFLWFVVICAIVISFDQLMVSFPLETPVLKETQTFYVDFRQRLVDLATDKPAPQKTPTKQTPPNKTNPTKQAAQKKPSKSSVKKAAADSIANVISQSAPAKSQDTNSRYLYVDGNGDLQFVDDFAQVPQRYRDSAQPMAE